MKKERPPALQKALALLGARQRTSLELESALARAGYAKEERSAALARVRELGYMDDREVARVRAEGLLRRGIAPRLAAQRLQAKGIARGEVEAALAAARGGASEDELAQAALQRKLRGRPLAGEDDRKRLFRQLATKGHRPSAVAKALGLTRDGDDDDQD